MLGFFFRKYLGKMIVEIVIYVRTNQHANATNIAVGNGEKLSEKSLKGTNAIASGESRRRNNELTISLKGTNETGFVRHLQRRRVFWATVVGLHSTLLHSWLSATRKDFSDSLTDTTQNPQGEI